MPRLGLASYTKGCVFLPPWHARRSRGATSSDSFRDTGCQAPRPTSSRRAAVPVRMISSTHRRGISLRLCQTSLGSPDG